MIPCVANPKLAGEQSHQPEEGSHQGDPGKRWHYNREGQPFKGRNTIVCHLVSSRFTSHHDHHGLV